VSVARESAALSELSVRSDEPGIGIEAEEGGGTDGATSESTPDVMGASTAGAVSAGKGTSRATAADPGALQRVSLGLEETGIAEMTRGTVFDTSRISTGCCSRERDVSLMAGLAMDVWLEWFHPISIAILFDPVLTLMIGRGAGNPPNRAR
jgi:hypothetical protein